MCIFCKLKKAFIRSSQASAMQITSEQKRYGNSGENDTACEIERLIPKSIVKPNVIVNTPDGNCEIDLLVVYENKIFVIEVKNWKGRLFQEGDYFVKEKLDRWTDDVHGKILKSPFGQVKRQIYLLKEQTKSNPWINPIVYFKDAESVIAKKDDIWFCNIKELVEYIKNDGKSSHINELNKCLANLVVADFLYSPSIFGERSLNCQIMDESLKFNIRGKIITKKDILIIDIDHHFDRDTVYFKLMDGSYLTCDFENYFIIVREGNALHRYSFSKIQKIIIGH